MNRNTAITVTVIIIVLIVAIVIWSLAMRSSDTTQEEYSPSPTVQTTPQEDISVDSTIDSDFNTLEQELQGL